MASRGLNKVQLIGHLGQDPEVRYLPNGKAVANLSLATSDTWKDKQTGEPKERTEWHRVVLYEKLADVAGEYLRKGAQVYIEGELRTRKWADQNGQERYTTEVVVSMQGTMQMLGSRGNGGNASVDNGQQQGGMGNPSNRRAVPTVAHLRNSIRRMSRRWTSMTRSRSRDVFYF